jgi:hypothetical protein
MPIILDANVPILPSSNKLWAVFPGEDRQFYRYFVENSVVFLDLPGAQLNADVLESDDLLRRNLALARRISAWHFDPENNNNPSRDIRVIDPLTGRSAVNQITNIRLMFKEMKVGDLVLFAGPSFYDKVWVGVIKSVFDPEDRIEIREYRGETIPFRKVKWLTTKIERRELPQVLSQLLSNRRAVIQIDKQIWGDFIYSFSYENFVSDTDSRYVFHGRTYRKNALEAVPPIRLISYFEAAYNSAEENQIQEFVALDIQHAIDNFFEQDLLNAFQVEFNSPGTIALAAKRAAMPILIALLVFVTSGDHTYAQAQNAQIVNKGAVDTPAARACMLEVKEKYRAIMNQLGADRFNEIVCLNQEAKAGTGLETKVKERANRTQPAPRGQR